MTVRCRKRRGGAAAAALAALAASCASATEEGRAAPLSGPDVAHCLRALAGDEPRDAGRCPDYLLEPLESARTLCLESGGRPGAAPDPQVRALDLQADGDPEYLFDAAALVACAEAWSALSCGSLGCPELLVERSEGGWRTIAALPAGAGATLELRPGAAGGPPDLATGCAAGEEPCAERRLWRRKGTEYAVWRLEVRGFPVDPDGVPRGLRALVADVDLRATPGPDGEPLARLTAGSEVAILGRAVEGDDLYVSPCNACPSGFVPAQSVSSTAGSRRL